MLVNWGLPLPTEVPHFELVEDPSFWNDHNVQVLIRMRPLSNMEKIIRSVFSTEKPKPDLQHDGAVHGESTYVDISRRRIRCKTGMGRKGRQRVSQLSVPTARCFEEWRS
ncbi:hypothetical protein L1887_22115 [Cichorium endivia]|nr:hypothetical protein L1887_22115 [Cichorium endivia]